MKLHPGHGMLPVGHPHDFSIRGCGHDLERCRELLRVDGERVISGGPEWIGESAEDTGAGVVNS